MEHYYHAHKIDTEKCAGHMACMRTCPTEAIRIRNNKAISSDELCVDCGRCLKICPTEAIEPITNPIAQISNYKYKVVVPAPVIYSQFDPEIHPYIIHLAFKELGFDKVVDVNISSVVLARALMMYMENYKGRLPLISSHCPAIIRLIQVKYPDLVELIIPIDVPRELAAREIRQNLPKELDMKSEDIGITYITPCPAKIVSIKQPAEKTKSWFDGALSIKETYSSLYPHVIAIKKQFDISQVPQDFHFNAGWATEGNITKSAKVENWLTVSGLSHAKAVLDDIESSRIKNIDFVEIMSCRLGCIGGPYTVENPYVARTNSIKQQIKYQTEIEVDENDIQKKLKSKYFYFKNPILPRPTQYFDTDLTTSIKRMRERKRIYDKLPQINCGCCGAPTCLAFAEDCVRGEVELSACLPLAHKIKSKHEPVKAQNNPKKKK